MSSNRDKKLFLAVLLIGLAINVAATCIYHHYNLNKKRSDEIELAKSVLEKLHASFSMENALEQNISEFLDVFLTMDEADGSKFYKNWLETNKLTNESVTLISFVNGKALNAPETEKQAWELLLRKIYKDSRHRTILDQKQKNKLIKLLKGGVGYEMIEGRPGRLVMLNRGPERSFAIWKSYKSKAQVKVAIILLHAGKLNDRFIARYLIDNCKYFNNKIAFLNIFDQQLSVIPNSMKKVGKAIKTVNALAVKNMDTQISIGGEKFYMAARPDGRLFLCRLSTAKEPLPLCYLAAMFFWIPLLFKQFFLSTKSGFYSLQNLLLALVLAGLILPATGTAFFWKNFIETKRQSLKIENAARIEQSLFAIDQQHQQVVREHKFRFRYFNNILDQKPENLQKFIDESLRLELEMIIDTLLLVDAKGRFIRPYTGSLSTIRGLVMYPKPFRRKIVDEFLEMGWLAAENELEYVLNADEIDFDRHFNLSTHNAKVIIKSLGKIAAAEMLQTYNQKNGFARPGAKANLSTMVMGSFVDNLEESPGSIVAQNLGDFVELGFGIYKSRNYVDVIRDKNGRAVFASIIYASSNLTILSYWKRLFSDPDKWPENVKYVAISERPMWLSFPWPDTWRRMKSLFTWLKPPRVVFTDEVYINGDPHLRCSYAARNCLNYIISGYLPMKVIDDKIQTFKLQLIAGSLFLALTLLSVILHLVKVILQPADELLKGIDAIAGKNHDFRIKLNTQDEWQQLGNTFNDAIKGLKELQMANFVQNCILPDKPVTGQNCVFIGKTVSADEVGGDYYDAFAWEHGLTFIMGDVSGHSVSAAMVVSIANAVFCACHDKGIHLPSDILAGMNDLMLMNLRRKKMMTCFCGHINESGIMHYSNAGQSFPLLISESGIRTLKQVGYPLGATKKAKFKQDKLELPEKCRLLMYSDGVIEAQNSSGEMFGYERLEKAALNFGLTGSCEVFIDHLYKELKDFCQGIPWNDDVTLVIVEHNRKD